MFNVHVVDHREEATMLRTIAIGLLLALLALWPVHAFAQSSLWETYMAAGYKAYQQGNYPKAEQ